MKAKKQPQAPAAPLPDVDRLAVLHAVKDLEPRAVDVPEWGGRIYVRRLSGPELDAWEVAQWELGEQVEPGKRWPHRKNVRARLVCLTACDKDGARLFRDEDLPALEKRAGVVLDRVFAAAQVHNGFVEEVLEELEGKSEGGAVEPGGSASA